MDQNPRLLRHALVTTTAVFAALFASTGLLAQSKSSVSADSSFAVTARDQSAASEATNIHKHVHRANTAVGRAAKPSTLGDTTSKAAPVNAAPASVAANVFGFFPADLVYSGGPVVASLQSHAVYVNSNSNTGGCRGVENCWGDPEDFLEDLGRSNFIHLLDQYIGVTRSNRYTVGDHVKVTYPSGTIFDSDLINIVHTAAAKKGTGYGHIYHIFLPPGTDQCSNDGTTCYSPDNEKTFFYCAFHGSVDFTDIGHVLFSVQPYQNVPGCQVAPPNPNSQLIDSTNSTLSHELIEAITDPDLDAWFNLSSLDLAGAEIADECQPWAYNNGSIVPTFRIGSHLYEVQLEYSNTYHACINVP
jgi:hypothetical protein